MGLYKILLVDDEEEVRKSIQKKIEWGKLGFKVVGDAENGEDALEKVIQLDPDLILTDIKMPYMDGLKLAEEVKKERSHIEIILFSGFDEFEYAQQAIKCNVIEYILKPVNVEELTGILKKIKKKLDEKLAEKRDIDVLRENYQKMLPVLQEQFFHDFMHGRLTKEKVEEGLLLYHPRLLQAKSWFVVSVLVEIPTCISGFDLQPLHQEKELIPISVQKMLEEKLNTNHLPHVFFRTSLGFALLCGLERTRTSASLLSLFNKICKECKRVLEVSVTIGIGEAYTDKMQMQTSYFESRDALFYRVSVGDEVAIYIRDVEEAKTNILRFDEQMEGLLVAALKFGTKEDLSDVLERMTHVIRTSKGSLRARQGFWLSVINSILQFIQRYELKEEVLFEQEIDYLEMIKKLEESDLSESWFFEVCNKIRIQLEQERNNSEKNIIKDAKAYLLENFRNPELSVEMVCEYLHLSPAYFSTIFKKETGENYVNYLTDLRLNKAMELLGNTEDKTYVIAAKVGYTEPNYFSYVFKKKFGVSPSKYRGK